MGVQLGRLIEGDEVLTPLTGKGILCPIDGAPGASQERGSAWRRRVELVFATLQGSDSLEGRSAFRALDTALRAEFLPGQASATLARCTETGCVDLQPLEYQAGLYNY